jgi:hypothetical protein
MLTVWGAAAAEVRSLLKSAHKSPPPAAAAGAAAGATALLSDCSKAFHPSDAAACVCHH